MEEAWQKRPLVALVGFQGLILKCASETLNLGDFLKRIYLFRMVTPG